MKQASHNGWYSMPPALPLLPSLRKYSIGGGAGNVLSQAPAGTF
jgi:hypothetical protein